MTEEYILAQMEVWGYIYVTPYSYEILHIFDVLFRKNKEAKLSVKTHLGMLLITDLERSKPA